MALIKCPECGKEISNQAKACMHCGYPISKVKLQTESTPIVTESTELNQDKTSVEQLPVFNMDEKQKKRIFLVVSAVVLVFIMIWCLKSCHDNKMARQRDLSNVFDLSFDMTMDDVIEYEKERYGNTEHDFDPENNRLDFEKYSYDDWKHRYFFDKETGFLTSFHYSGIIVTFGDDSDAECEHVKPLKRKLLNEIGDWDEKPTGDGVRSVAYGQIDGKPCKVLYFDGASQEIAVYFED